MPQNNERPNNPYLGLFWDIINANERKTNKAYTLVIIVVLSIFVNKFIQLIIDGKNETILNERTEKKEQKRSTDSILHQRDLKIEWLWDKLNKEVSGDNDRLQGQIKENDSVIKTTKR